MKATFYRLWFFFCGRHHWDYEDFFNRNCLTCGRAEFRKYSTASEEWDCYEQERGNIQKHFNNGD